MKRYFQTGRPMLPSTWVRQSPPWGQGGPPYIFIHIILVDKLTRCNGDEFIQIMKQEFCLPFGKHSAGSDIPTLRDVQEIPSHLEQYQVNQVCDILMGCILNNLKPAKNQLKNELRKYLIEKSGVENLLPETWLKYPKWHLETYSPKFNIWYWKP